MAASSDRTRIVAICVKFVFIANATTTAKSGIAPAIKSEVAPTVSARDLQAQA